MRKLDFETEGFKLVCPLQVRFRDTDAMGHVNNAVYLSYSEYARMEYMRKLFGMRDFSQNSFILGRVEIEYLSPALLQDELSAGIRCSAIRGASFDFEYAIWAANPRRLAAVARTTQVMYDYGKKKTMRITQDFRSKIEAFEGRSFSY